MDGKGSAAPGGGAMKAPGGDGSYISREEFEKNPQGYFAGLHAAQKDNKDNVVGQGQGDAAQKDHKK